MLGRFVVPASRLVELGRAATDHLPEAGAGEPWRLSALVGADPQADGALVEAFNAAHAGRAVVDTVELKAANTEQADARRSRRCPPGLAVFVEVSARRGPRRPAGGAQAPRRAREGPHRRRGPRGDPGPGRRRPLRRRLRGRRRALQGHRRPAPPAALRAGAHLRARQPARRDARLPQRVRGGRLRPSRRLARGHRGRAARGAGRGLPPRRPGSRLAAPAGQHTRAGGDAPGLRGLVRLLLLRRAGGRPARARSAGGRESAEAAREHSRGGAR